MSIILGLNANHADSSACIFVNGKLEFAIEEERINRIKHWAGLPCESIEECLKNTGLNINEITDISINTNPLSNIRNKGVYFLKNYLFGEKKFEIADRFKKKISLKDDINKYFSPKKISDDVKVHYIDHHISHIASAYYPSGFKKAIGLSIDGFGDFCSLMIAKCSEGKIKPIKKIYFPNSIGLLYEAFTQFIGFKKYGEEYKMMGLSSLGEPKYKDIIKEKLFDNFEKAKLNLQFFNHHKNNFLYNFKGEPNQSQILNDSVFDIFKSEIGASSFKEDIASSIQNIFEELLEIILNKCLKLNFSKNLVYAGGCALNSLANKKIFDRRYFDNIFIPYSPGDGGGSIGSSLYFLSKTNKQFDTNNLQNPYIGKGFNNNEINSLIKTKKLKENFNIKYFTNKKERDQILARQILKDNVIGFFSGKMEFGARALGNRSILANPTSPEIKDIINLKIKRRESFRPFAPTILFDQKNKWFDNNRLNPYMSSVENILPKVRKLIPAVTHYDGTGRVQTVSKETNIDFYNLILEFFKISKVPILLNTSFNENEPIVMTPENAIDCFQRTKMDTLVLENFLISRHEV